MKHKLRICAIAALGALMQATAAYTVNISSSPNTV